MFRISYFDNAGKRECEHELIMFIIEYYHPLLTFPTKLRHLMWDVPVSMGKSASGDTQILKYVQLLQFNDRLNHPLLTFPSKLGHLIVAPYILA